MKVDKFKKMSKGRYKITLSDLNEFILYEEVIFKHELLLKKDINAERLDEILEDNKYYEAYNIALSYIEYKLRSKKELKDYLERKEFDFNLINKIIEDLTNRGYINDKAYAKAFIQDKLLFTNYGPNKIKASLINSGVDENIASEAVSNISYDIFEDKVKKIIEKRKKLNKKTINIFKMKTIEYLLSLGYDKEMIMSHLYIDEDVVIENSIEKLIKERNKLIEKYSKKYSGSKLDYQVKAALYRKGYTSNDINKISDYE